MKKILHLLMVGVVAFLLPASALWAQEREVKGTVYDSDGKTPLVGTTVLLKGTNKIVVASDGRYVITVSGDNPVLLFQLIGYETQEAPVGARAVLDVVMKESALQLQEVVVTALGITREEKSLGYAVSKISNEELTSTVSNNWMNAMSGKVAGLILDNAGSGPGGAIRVTLRGDQSLTHGANGALFVVDGVPISSAGVETSSGANYANNDAPVDFGNGANDINPDNVESVTVLKGPAATALYGSRAANGAIIITTKSGRTQKGVGVTVSSSVVFEQAGFWPKFQTEYGNGADNGERPFVFWPLTADMAPDGVATSRHINRYTFGEKFDANQLRYIYASKNWDTGTFTKLPWVYQDDWYTGIFETGVTFNNAVSIDGGNGKGTSARLSITDTRNNWILPNTGYEQQAIALALNTEVNKYVKLNTKINYFHKQSDNLPNSGYQANDIMYALAWAYNINSMSQWRDEYFNGRYNTVNHDSPLSLNGNSLVYPAESSYNPYRTLYEELNGMNRDRIYGNIGLNIALYEGLTLDIRSGLDMATEFRTQQRPYWSADNEKGYYREQSFVYYELNTDFLLRYTNNTWVGNRLGFTAAFGGNAMTNHYRQTRTTLNQLDIPGVYNTSNVPAGMQAIPYNYRSNKAVNSFYGFVSAGWDDTFFLDLTARNDWSSTLGRGNWSYFYPSVSLSVLFDQLFKLRTVAPWVDIAKLRVSWANVGNDTDPYSLDQYYSASSYAGGYTLSGTIPDPLIKPENVESWEAGIEAKFFNNRLGFDVAVYNSSTTDQIVTISTDRMIGASGMRINAGEIRNRGLEIAAHFVPVKTKDFAWSLDVNWSRIWNKLVSLQDDWDPTVPLQTDMGTTIGSRTYIYSYVGEEMHVIYGKGFQKAPEGTYYIDKDGNRVDCSGMDIVDAQGYPVFDEQTTTRIAKVNPDWRAGLTTRFTYKNLSLGMTFTGQWGGHAFSVTNFALSYQGKLQNSIEGRYDGLVHPGVNRTINADGSITYTENTTVTENIQTYYNARLWVRDNTEYNTFSTSFLKFKEARLDYSLPAAIAQKIGFLQGASIGVYATNIFCLTEFPQYDPEVGMLHGNDIFKGIETMSFPMTRTYGVNLKLSF
ncbi:MAG: SusC/RagA family TonB-linked outer membrane protein [Prevotellaceae bacterium]|jgi:TonB-linked SusC/RagA family outer membrane protein|nr:SusC/RagA family TonB-linked outer membrane protein [Prevotellaceae bacterium]